MQINLQKRKNFSEDNMRRIINLIIGISSQTSQLQDQCLTDYDETRVYSAGNITIYDGYIWEAKTVATGTWDSSKWTKIGTDDITEIDLDTVKSWLNLSSEELDNLQKLLKDDQITTTSTFSSSKIYSDLQAAIDTAKEYTNNQLGKAVKPAYKVVSSTSEVTETGYFYLISNGTNYDMYVLSSDGSVVSLGTSEVDLSNYYTKTEVDSDFLKKTDATSTYATITTVDGKVDKANIIIAKDNSATDDQVYSASVVNTELDLKANKDEVVKKTNITTDIGGTSTDDKVPSAKAIFNSCIQGKIIDQSVIDTYGTEILKYPLGRWLIVPDNVAEKFKDLPVKQSGHIDITSIAYNDNNPWTAPFTYRVCSYVPYSGGNYVRKMESGGTAGVVSDTGWQRVCTTRVEDKTFNATSITSLNSKYTFIRVDGVVKNGFCMCTLGIRVVEPAPTFESITSNMPKPQKVYYSPPILNWSDADGLDTTSPLHITVAPDGYLRCEHGIAGKDYYVTVAYPVAES